jgi:hypothetical protein
MFPAARALVERIRTSGASFGGLTRAQAAFSQPLLAPDEAAAAFA